MEEESLFPREIDLIDDGYILDDDLGDRRVYRKGNEIIVTAQNGFEAAYDPDSNGKTGEISCKTENGFVMRSGTLEEAAYLMELVEDILKRLSQTEAKGVYIKIYDVDGPDNYAKRLKMFDHFFKLTPGKNDLGYQVHYIGLK